MMPHNHGGPFLLGADIGKLLRMFKGRVRFTGITFHHWGFGFIHWEAGDKAEAPSDE